ncbi:CHAT domain-containing protein [Bryobacter aggregatus]|uniref:CHAT domain-containing protein n=1 Tax=Bryobacter aggregatus TaxID=360054 RepID=UPI0004E1ADA8|nr:CHAT domain-containing protein [Bryobacter aggregatus]
MRPFWLVSLLTGLSNLYAEGPAEALAKADSLADLRAWSRAEPFFIEAERGFTQVGDSRNALYATLGRIRGELPRRSNAEVSQQLAEILESPLAITDDRIRLRCLVIKGETDEDYDALLAEQDWREALSIAKRLNDNQWVNRANGELGIVAALQGKTSEGLFLLASALKAAEESQDLSSVVRWLSIIGQGFIQFGRPEEALKYFDRALAAGSPVEELRYPLMAYAGKVNALTKLGRTKEARELLASALTVARDHESLGYQAELLRTDALLAETAGLRDEAIAILQQALQFARSASANRILAEIYLDLGRLQIAAGQKKDAANSFKSGVEVARSMRERLLTPRLLAKFAESERSQGRAVEARELLQEASEVTEGLLAGVWSPWVKSRLVGIMDEVFLARVRLETGMGSAPDRLLPIIEQARGRALTDLLMGRGQGERNTAVAAKEGQRRISALQTQLWGVKSAVARQRLLDKIFRAESDMMAVSVQEDRKRQVELKRNPLRMTNLRQVLAPDEMLLEYVVDDPASFVLIVTREQASIQKLPGRTQLKKSVDIAWKAIQAGQDIDATLPLPELIRVPNIETKTRIIVVPDGDLHRLPFELLTTSKGARLLQSHAVSYSPSATALYFIRSQPHRDMPRNLLKNTPLPRI